MTKELYLKKGDEFSVALKHLKKLTLVHIAYIKLYAG